MPDPPLCQYCKKNPVEPPRRKFCSPRCSNLAYQSRRYKADGDFQVRHRNCWKVYVTECRVCGKPLRAKAKCDHDVRIVIGDAESLFGSPEARMRIVAHIATDNNPGMTAEEIFNMLMKEGEQTGVRHETLMKIIKEVML